MTHSPLVTVAILNYNGKLHLQQNIPFLFRLTYSNVQIAVIDNASEDDSLQWLEEQYPQVRIIRNKENFGFAKGYNEGLKNITSDYYLLLNTDVEVTPCFLEPMVAVLEKEKRAAACQPKILSLQRRHMFEYAGAAGGMLDKFGYPFARGRLFFTCEADQQQYNDEREIFWASGACFLIKAKYFWEVGGFYEYFFMQSEEVDLCWRLSLKGYKILFTARSEVYHLGGAFLAYNSARKTQLNFRNNWIMLYRNMPEKYFWRTIVPYRLILDIIASIYFLLKANYKSSWAVYSALYQFSRWYLSIGKTERKGNMEIKSLNGVYNQSIVIAYFLKGKKRYIDL